jgi:HD-like signal output (HDOD) protein
MAPEAASSESSAGVERCRLQLLEQIEAGAFRLPVLPHVFAEILALTADRDADIGRLSAVVHRDPGIAGHVLRVANSAAYTASQPIVSLQQAITRLGLALVAECALASSVQDQVFRVPGFEAPIARVWRHALASGLWGKEIARLRRHNVEGQFLCGLLHTVGIPVALAGIAEAGARAGRPIASGAALELAHEVHEALGHAVARAWKLTAPVAAACRHYRDPAAAPEHRVEVAATSLSDRLASWALDPAGEREAPSTEDPAAAELNLYPDDLAELLARRAGIVAAVEAADR